MKHTPTTDQNDSLDPDDWEALGQVGHRMVDDMIEHLRTVRERPAWQPIPAGVKSVFREQIPAEPQPAEETYDEFDRYVRPYLTLTARSEQWQHSFRRCAILSTA